MPNVTTRACAACGRRAGTPTRVLCIRTQKKARSCCHFEQCKSEVELVGDTRAHGLARLLRVRAATVPGRFVVVPDGRPAARTLQCHVTMYILSCRVSSVCVRACVRACTLLRFVCAAGRRASALADEAQRESPGGPQTDLCRGWFVLRTAQRVETVMAAIIVRIDGPKAAQRAARHSAQQNTCCRTTSPKATPLLSLNSWTTCIRYQSEFARQRADFPHNRAGPGSNQAPAFVINLTPRWR